MNEFRNLRSRLLVNREIQGRMMGRLTVYWLAYHLILWHGLFLAEWMQQQIGAITSGSSVSILHAYSTFVRTQHLLPIVALAMFPIVLWDMFKLSHRIAGPLVQVRNRLIDMTNGCPPKKVQFRRGDMMSEIQQSFNDWVESLNVDPSSPAETQAQAEEQYSRLIQQVKALQDTMKTPKPDADEPEPVDADASVAECEVADSALPHR